MCSSVLGITSITIVLLLTKAAASNRGKSTARAALLQQLIARKSYFNRPLDYTDTDLIVGLQSLLVPSYCHIIETVEIGNWEIYFQNFLQTLRYSTLIGLPTK